MEPDIKQVKHLDEQIQLGSQSMKQDQLLNLLKEQRIDFKQSQLLKRKNLQLQKKHDDRVKQQSMSDGLVQHPAEFRKANRQIDRFESTVPILKFPEDIVLNTYDNTKRWLREMDVEDRKLYWKNLRQNDSKHYKGKPFTYAPGIPDKFEEFKAYHFIEHEESGKDKCKRLKEQQLQLFLPSRQHSNQFSLPKFDRTNIHVSLNKIHDVKYVPNLFTDSRTISQLQSRSNMSQLNQVQIVKPFTSCNQRSQIFHKSYKPLNSTAYNSNRMQSTIRSKLDMNQEDI